MPADAVLNDKPLSEVYKVLPNSVLNSATQRVRQSANRQVAIAERKIEKIVQRTVMRAADTLGKVARAGPKIADNLNDNLKEQLSPDALDTSARTYERLIDVSRRQLGLDREEAAKPSIQVNVLAAIGSSLDPTVTSGPVLELPAETIADPTEEP